MSRVLSATSNRCEVPSWWAASGVRARAKKGLPRQVNREILSVSKAIAAKEKHQNHRTHTIEIFASSSVIGIQFP
jgi:hypothetical protein